MDEGRQLINGRYRLVEVIGQGGMGTVWRGHDEMLDREVAIKEVTLPPGLDDDERAELSTLALREARATARLNHPGIITIYDVIDDDGVPIIVMELLPGRSLADILKEEVRLPYRRVAEIGRAALEALREAHAAGVVHRDLKPANILISDRRIVITDFGVAQRVGERTDEPGDITGTPAFMAPEQAENAAASPAADLWALGATLFNATEGRPPYEGPDHATVLLTLLTQDPPAPVRAGPLAPVITALLRRDPERRLSAEEVADRFAEILREEPDGATARAAIPQRPAIAPAATEKPAVSEKPAAPSPPKTAGPARSDEDSPVRKVPPPHRNSDRDPRIPPVDALPHRPPPAVRPSRVLAITALVVLGLTVLYTGIHAGSGHSPASAPAATPSVPLGDPLPTESGPPTGGEPPDDPDGFDQTAFSPDGDAVVFGGSSEVVRVYDTATRRLRRSWKTDGEIQALTFSPDGRTVAAALDSGSVDTWDLATRHKHEYSGIDEVVDALGYSSDGRTLTAVGTNGHIAIWTVRTGRRVASTMPSGCLGTALSSDGYDVACGYYQSEGGGSGIFIWNAKENRQRTSWPGAEPDGMAFSPDGKTIVFSSTRDGRLELWDVASHTKTIELHSSWVAPDGLWTAPEGGLVFSPDGRTLAVTSTDSSADSSTDEDIIDIWEIPGAKKTSAFRLIDTPKTLALSPRGDMLVIAEGHGTLWNLPAQKQLASWTG
ncbi:protein kinase [Actinoallomurus sp. NBC_01490]|uniref:WD40 repeat domain-containing serine/threonine protein kinase n=1 Tax=Actinoallomurus sp. NBC_01490 TaxID=2903557 RepID=UPI002E37C457|nr:protein kinase [Actinoallomurus sp. NBC_01490]